MFVVKRRASKSKCGPASEFQTFKPNKKKNKNMDTVAVHQAKETLDSTLPVLLPPVCSPTQPNTLYTCTGKVTP